MKHWLAIVSVLVSGVAAAAEVKVPMQLVDERGVGESVGTVTIKSSRYGLVFTPALDRLPPGMHGFHVHENPSCEPKEKDGKPVAALAAGGHYDPKKTNRHAAPWEDGHLGDLPALMVDADGRATYPVLAPRLKLKDIQNRALMIHAGADNHADHPAPLGGGGGRIACGVISR